MTRCMLVLCLGVLAPLSLQGATGLVAVARSAPGGKAGRPNIFSSQKRSKYWRKRCTRDKRSGLRRADVLNTVRRTPISLFAAMDNSSLYGLALRSSADLAKLLTTAKRRKKGVARSERIAELCYALAIHHQLAARRDDSRIRRHKALGNTVPGKLMRRYKLAVRQSRLWLERALSHYRLIVAMGHGALKRQAGPLFRVASLSMELATHPANRRLVKQRLKYAKIVLKSLRSLLRHHPRSRFIELALLAKGAMYYHLGQYGEATKVLRQVRKWYNREAPYAMYLLGWSLYKSGKYKKARIHLRAASRSGRSSKKLVRVARQDLVLVTSHLNIKRAYRYFRGSVKGRDKSAARQMLKRLARVLVARNKRKPAIRLYRSFLKRWRKNRAACLWVRTLEGLLRGGR